MKRNKERKIMRKIVLCSFVLSSLLQLSGAAQQPQPALQSPQTEISVEGTAVSSAARAQIERSLRRKLPGDVSRYTVEQIRSAAEAATKEVEAADSGVHPTRGGPATTVSRIKEIHIYLRPW